MYKKRALVLGGYLSLLALAACGPKVIDDSDLVTIDYKYMFSDGTIIDQGSKDFTVGEAGDLSWIEDVVRGAKLDEEFNGTINGMELYGSQHDSNKVQSYPNVILTEVLGVRNPEIGSKVYVNSFGSGIISKAEKDDEGNDVYVVEFNEPKTFSELSYTIRVTNIEKK